MSSGGRGGIGLVGKEESGKRETCVKSVIEYLLFEV